MEIPGIEEIVEGVPEWPDDVKGGDEEELDEKLGLDGDRLRAHHPIFNIPYANAKMAKEWSEGIVGF
jgi:protein farnesyltransferase subunit beta